MLITLLSPLLGILGSLLPSIVRIFERKQEIKYELERTKLQISAAEKQADVHLTTEMVKADSLSRQSALDHDKSLDGGVFINTLRASIRPVITYAFFLTFLGIKIAALTVMINQGASMPEMLKAVWDQETMSLFATIIAFWFGSRMMEKREAPAAVTPTLVTTMNSTAPNKAATTSKKK